MLMSECVINYSECSAISMLEYDVNLCHECAKCMLVYGCEMNVMMHCLELFYRVCKNGGLNKAFKIACT